MARKLPIGIQSFEKIRHDGFAYVDKTAFVHSLAQAGVSVFSLSFNGADYTREGGLEGKLDAMLRGLEEAPATFAVIDGGEAEWVPRRRILVRWYDRERLPREALDLPVYGARHEMGIT